jgi:predicted transcriptional regulator YdeE
MTDFDQLTHVYQCLNAGEKMTYQFKIIIGNLDHAVGMKEMDALEDQIEDLETEMSARTRYATITLQKYMEELRELHKGIEEDLIGERLYMPQNTACVVCK